MIAKACFFIWKKLNCKYMLYINILFQENAASRDKLLKVSNNTISVRKKTHFSVDTSPRNSAAAGKAVTQYAMPASQAELQLNDRNAVNVRFFLKKKLSPLQTHESIVSEAQFKKFFILWKNHALFSRYSILCNFTYTVKFNVCKMMCISTCGRMLF